MPDSNHDLEESSRTQSLAVLVLYSLRGLLMGAADVVPGVSGGTVALLLGIYTRLVAALSSVNLEWLSLLRQRKWRAASRHIDLPFLSSLLVGIGLGIVLLGSLIQWLLTHASTRPYTLASFFGMILASALLVAAHIRVRSPADRMTLPLIGILGGGVALAVTFATGQAVEPSLPYLFLCGVIAICAMILPGISGAYLLLILGVYSYVLDIISSAKHGQVAIAEAISLLVFASGCLLGLLSFSRVLKWLLSHRPSHTMAVLSGFMIGALRQIWPFQRDLTPQVEKLKEKEFEILWLPASWTLGLTTAVVALLAFGLVLGADYAARRHAAARPDEASA